MELVAMFRGRICWSECQAANKQLQRTVGRHRGRAASAPFHFALASLSRGQRAAAELRR